MFCYLAYCLSEDTQKWTNFYIETLENSLLQNILQKLVTNVNRKINEGKSTIAEIELYVQLDQLISFNMGKAVVGLHSKKKLLKDIDQPAIVSLKDIIGPCLENGTCGEVEQMVKSLNYAAYHNANHPVHILNKDGHQNPSALIPFCAFAGNMEVLGQTVENFTDPVCSAFSPTK